ncbi:MULTISPECIES: polysaccharide lyase [unclassified Novosphingobium]|uniref:polysaccharide lyase n=1 Tax=unclassified Novosphingobium TaxID=2644732 RepID=UPI00086C7277|nr:MULTISPECIES: polysaccharide lyase [unclassified Novosphingobium]MBN9145386.1 polysaccharide lyase [Novosphingobium sp.]MDR6709873.1 hypothetical protein [Novosphingobium sp. 1748]ODU83150.1 MAG: hypothetical protein ABT10_08150 [Novosphingobium sp. SCN 63-17]OJX88108.1 MAG: hypothetical protein BGP00_01990 [Novosphingobium sp. 63-713]
MASFRLRRLASGAVAGFALAGGAALAAHHFTLAYGQPVDVTFRADEPAGTSETDLMLGKADYALQYCCATSTRLVANPLNPQRMVREFRVAPTEPLVKGNHRAELRLRPNALGQEVWYRVSVFIPEDWVPSPRHSIIFQWHGSRDVLLLEPGKYPPLDIGIESDHWTIHKSWDNRIATPPHGAVQGISEIGQAPLTKGSWQCWTVSALWSSTAQGRLRLWLGDRIVTDDKGPNAHRDYLGPYLKAGIYESSWHYDGADPKVTERRVLIGPIQVRYGSDPFGVINHRADPSCS